jgi:polar amino acid transport system substrate-binding protein
VKSVLNGDADILPAIAPTSALRDKLIFTKPYLSLPLVIATRREEFFVGDLDKLAGKQIGIVDRGNILRRFRNNYPSLSFQIVDSVHEGLYRVEQEQDFAFVGTIPSIAYAVQKHNLFNIKISGKLEETLPVSAAVGAGQEDLASVLNKMLQSVPAQRREEMIDRWISISLEEKVDYSIVWQISGISALVIAVVIFWLKKVHSYNREISHAYALLEDKNRELEQMSITNQLTGLYNRNKLDPALEQEKERAVRYKSIFSVIMLDIDDFKSINDNFGHQTGDKVLKHIGGLIQNRVRVSDTAGRWGGEEFLIICPATDLSGAHQLAERIRQDVQTQTTAEGVCVTISAGVVEYKTGEDTETLVKRVDGKLYEAKRSGRNKVTS